MNKILKEEFFKKPALEVSENLLGKILVRKIGQKKLAVKITELEIYDGFEDKASHASRGETERNEIMFEEGGYFYIYLVYGMHWMINIVVGKKDRPSAILLRDGEVLSSSFHESEKSYSSVLQKTTIRKTGEMIGGKINLDRLARLSFTPQNLGGPGKLSKFLKVDKKFNKKKAELKTGLWFEDWGFKIPKNKIKKTSRIGVHYAGPYWSKKKWRFVVK